MVYQSVFEFPREGRNLADNPLLLLSSVANYPPPPAASLGAKISFRAPLVDVRIGKLFVSSDPGSTHSAMNPENASYTGASLKVAPFPPNAKVTDAIHVPTDCKMPDSSDCANGGMLHDPDVQATSSIWLTAALQSDLLTVKLS